MKRCFFFSKNIFFLTFSYHFKMPTNFHKQFSQCHHNFVHHTMQINYIASIQFDDNWKAIVKCSLKVYLIVVHFVITLRSTSQMSFHSNSIAISTFGHTKFACLLLFLSTLDFFLSSSILFEGPSLREGACPQKCQLKSKRNEKWTTKVSWVKIQKKRVNARGHEWISCGMLCGFVGSHRCTNITHMPKKKLRVSIRVRVIFIFLRKELGRGFTTALHTSIDGHDEKMGLKNPRQINNSSRTHHLSLSCRTASEWSPT